MKKLFSVRAVILAGSLLLQLNTLCFQSRGAAGDVDLSFDPGSGVDGTVKAIAVQPDGKVIIAGNFATVKGLARTGIARLNADGSGDPTFNAGTTSSIDYYLSAIALQPDGKVIFTRSRFDVNVPGLLTYTAVRLNSDGTVDNSFIPDTGSYPYGSGFTCVRIQPDGKVLLGGYFVEYFIDGQGFSNYFKRSLLVRLNANGTADTSFAYVSGDISGGEYDAFIESMTLQPNGKVLIGGSLSTGTGVIRLNANGSLDDSFNHGGYGSLVALQSDGKVLTGGSSGGIIRLNANGSLDGSFNSTLAPSGLLTSIAVQPDGKLLIGGYFTSVNGTNCNRIARLNANGSLDNSFNPGTGANDYVWSMALQSDGKVLIGGYFTTVNSTNRERMARLNGDGSLDGSFNPGRPLEGAASWDISSLKVQPEGKVLIGGSFTYFDGTNPNGRARLNADGSLDGTFVPTSFSPDIGASFIAYPYNNYNVVTAAAGQSDGKVLIGGYTVHSDCDPEGCTSWPIYFLDRVNADGSRDPSFSYPDLEAIIGCCWDSYALKSIVVQSNGKVLLWGGIYRFNADGSPDSGFNLGTVVNGNVSSVALQSDGKVLIGGSFTSVNGASRNGIARLNANSSLDSSFNPGTGVSGGGVISIALQPDGKVLIGGDFINVNGTNRNRIARLNSNGSLDSSFNSGTGADAAVLSIALQPDGKVLIGGSFTLVNGALRPFIARLYGDSAPSLNIVRSNAFVIVSWPVTGLNFQLQEATDLSLPNSWSPVAQAAATNAGQISVTIPTAVGSKFFRLKSQ